VAAADTAAAVVAAEAADSASAGAAAVAALVAAAVASAGAGAWAAAACRGEVALSARLKIGITNIDLFAEMTGIEFHVDSRSICDWFAARIGDFRTTRRCGQAAATQMTKPWPKTAGQIAILI
jgi:hypothetical protein